MLLVQQNASSQDQCDNFARKRICLWSPAGIHFRPIAPTICAADYRAPSKPLFQKLGIFDIYSLLSFQVGSFMYLYHHEMLPLSFQNLFQTGSQIRNSSTRYTESYRPHACRTNIKKITILYQGPKLWNSLPLSVIRSNNLRTFKRLLKSYLINLPNTR